SFFLLALLLTSLATPSHLRHAPSSYSLLLLHSQVSHPHRDISCIASTTSWFVVASSCKSCPPVFLACFTTMKFIVDVSCSPVTAGFRIAPQSCLIAALFVTAPAVFQVHQSL
ncbi:hypothetical protein K438DRAFT_1872175, partial [Mycena galopus ATCC 62051]